jgi:hypothetical protein
VVVEEAHLTSGLRSEVALNHDAQRDARALALANVAASDLITLTNVVGPQAFGAAAGVAQQHNHTTQREPVGARLGAWSVLTGVARHDASAFRNRTTERHRQVSEAIVDRSVTRRSEVHQVNARVPGFSPARAWEVDLDLGAMPDIALPEFGFDWTTGDEPFRFGVAADFSGLVLEGPGLSLGSLRADGDDLVIEGGRITLPGLTLPDVRGELCAFECFGGTVSGTRVEGQTLSFDVGDIRLAGANPFKDLDLQLGQGIAAVGSGTFDVGGVGARVEAELEFQLPSLGGQTISFDVVPSLGFMSREARREARKVLPDVPTVTLEIPEIELPRGEFRVTLVDVEAPTYAGAFGFSGRVEDGVVCLAVASNDCGRQSYSKTETRSRIEERTSLVEEHAVEHERHGESHETERRPGAVIGGAEASTMVLGRSEAATEDFRVVVVRGDAQRDVRTLNLTNATTATIAGTANVLATSPRGGPPGVPARAAAAGAVSQSNVFLQGFR